MSFLGMILCLLVGIFLLSAGKIAKKKWLMLVSMLPLAFALGQLVMLLLIGWH